MADEDLKSPSGGVSLVDLVSTGKPSLAHFSVVDKLVRDFAASVMVVKSAFARGEPGADKPLELIEEHARKMGDIVLGRDPSFDVQPWNNDARLGNTLRVLLPNETKHYGDPGAALFMWLANQTMKAASSIDAGSSEESAQKSLAAVCEDVTARIMGIR